MRTGIFGGTFNPPHLGHAGAARQASELLGLDRLLVVPSRVPPHKSLPADAPSAADRLKMARLAFRDVENCEISDIELRREGESYTADTLRELREAAPDDELIFIMGSDMLKTFPRWYRPDEILRLAKLAAFPRLSDDGVFREASAEARGFCGARLTLLDIAPVEISSTYLRKILPTGAGYEYMDAEVLKFILQSGFYGCGALPRTLDELREWSYPRHKPTRLPHIRGCESEAVRLAGRWGADTELAARAAVLHDVTKILSFSEQLKMCERYDIILDNAERAENKLLHQITGAFAAKRLGQPPEVVSAVRWHTTGRANMTPLEKIIFLADYIEPSRDFADLTEIRRVAYEDMDAAILMGLKMTVEEVEARGGPVHPNTLLALKGLENEAERKQEEGS